MTKKSTEQIVSWLRGISGELSTATIKNLDATLPWYRDMPPGRRSAVGLVAQAGISSFIKYLEDPQAEPWVAADVFAAAPRELLRSISLQQTLQLIRVTVETVEERLLLEEDDALTSRIRLYSREIAFSAADVYARAAEARGLWDARLEALVVDSILTGEYDDELPSRIAALGWQGKGGVCVVVGRATEAVEVDQIRRTARKFNADVLVGVQGVRLIVVIGSADEGEESKPNFMDIVEGLTQNFDEGPIVVGHPVESVVEASRSAKAALAGFAVAGAYRNCPRPVLSDELLPERALAGDSQARQRLVSKIYNPIKNQGGELLNTLWCYIDNGRSLEATARELFVHPNTVRYRLKRIAEIVGWDPMGPREAQIMQSAIIVGSIADAGTVRSRQLKK
ncbi:MAG: helix-turn-helix domain-containing protein [Microbacteriaceae bacterium]|nr:helix-turn-helix domain-containing protein [Microbacteriaceae bacterium]